MTPVARWGRAVGAVALLLVPAPAAAGTIGDAVRKHAEEHTQPHKRSAPPPHHPAPPPPIQHWQPAPAPPPGPAPEKEKVHTPSLPLRVIGKDLQLDPQIGAGYHGWYPQQYPTVSVATRGYFTWSIGMRAKFFNLLTLERGFYESTALSAPRTDSAAVAAQAGSYIPKAAWLLGAVGFPIKFVIEPYVRYEARAFDTTATPGSPVRIIPRSASQNDPETNFPLTQAPLHMTSSYESFVIAGKYNPQNAGLIGAPSTNVPPFYVGLGVVQFVKPYQFNVGDAVLDKYIFDARFRGAGIAIGLTTPEDPDKFFVDFSAIGGLGEVRLLSDLTLNQAVADNTYIGFVQGNVTVGYLLPLLRTRPTLLLGMSVSGGGATFFFFKTKYQQNEQIDTPPVNWDILWAAQTYLVLPL